MTKKVIYFKRKTLLDYNSVNLAIQKAMMIMVVNNPVITISQWLFDNIPGIKEAYGKLEDWTGGIPIPFKGYFYYITSFKFTGYKLLRSKDNKIIKSYQIEITYSKRIRVYEIFDKNNIQTAYRPGQIKNIGTSSNTLTPAGDSTGDEDTKKFEAFIGTLTTILVIIWACWNFTKKLVSFLGDVVSTISEWISDFGDDTERIVFNIDGKKELNMTIEEKTKLNFQNLQGYPILLSNSNPEVCIVDLIDDEFYLIPLNTGNTNIIIEDSGSGYRVGIVVNIENIKEPTQPINPVNPTEEKANIGLILGLSILSMFFLSKK